MLILVIIAVAWFIVIPQYDEASREIESLKNVSIILVMAAAVLEAGSLVSYSLLTAVVLGRVRPHFFTILRIDLTDLGVNHIAPGGGTTAAAVRFGLLKEAGVASTTALAAASIEIIISNLMLGLVFLAGIILSLSSLAYNKYYVATAVIVAIIIAVAAVMGWLISKHT